MFTSTRIRVTYQEHLVQRGKKLNLGQEYEADDDHADWFNEIFDQDLC